MASYLKQEKTKKEDLAHCKILGVNLYINFFCKKYKNQESSNLHGLDKGRLDNIEYILSFIYI